MRIIRYFSLAFSILWLQTETEAFGQFIVGDTISSNVTYYNIPDTVLPFVVQGSSVFDVDIDFDGIRDVRLNGRIVLLCHTCQLHKQCIR